MRGEFNMKEKRRSIGFTLALVNFCIFLIALLGVGIIYMTLTENENIKIKILKFILVFVVFGSVGYIAYNLKKIIKNVKDKNIFIMENVKRFKSIGTYVIIFGIIYSLVFYSNRTDNGIVIIGTPYGSLGPEFFLYLILGGLAFILAYIFEEAIKLKNEQDLTI